MQVLGDLDRLTDSELATNIVIVDKRGGWTRIAHQKQQIEHEIRHLRLLAVTLVVDVYGKVGEETVVGLEAEHVDSVSTLSKEVLIVPLDQLDRVVEESLGIQRVSVEIERQDRLAEDCVEPKGRFFFENDL